MRLTIQRVTNASVVVDEAIVSSISNGLVCFAGFGVDDTKEDAEWACKKILNTRLWPNDQGKQWDRSVLTNSYEVLLVSQFTLHGIVNGNKPDFHLSMPPEPAKVLYEDLIQLLRKNHQDPSKVVTGIFGAYMNVSLINDGPVTINLDSKNRKPWKSNKQQN